MSKTHRVRVTVKHMSIEGGFWGLFDQQGRKWLPVNLPEQLKREGVEANCTLEEMPDVVTSYNWGTPVRITSFETPA